MRHFALAALAAIVVAVIVVLVVAEEEVSEDRVEPRATAPAVTRDAPPPATARGGDPVPAPRGRLRERADRVEQAVSRYVEAAERGQVDSPGLPTSDELSFVGIYLARRRATAALIGGATVRLRRAGGRWRVVRVSVPTPEPTPPSNGP